MSKSPSWCAARTWRSALFSHVQRVHWKRVVLEGVFDHLRLGNDALHSPLARAILQVPVGKDIGVAYGHHLLPRLSSCSRSSQPHHNSLVRAPGPNHTDLGVIESLS